MSRIQILPEVLANKIAAGEVVERPASVVKELVENALDAQSTRILINIEKGGRSLIQVADNGTGMNHDDALLALERFATSKIHSDEDLFAIRTLGFRGEALPSIAAVSKMTLVTRDSRSDSGVAVKIHGGKVVQVSETGAPQGTMISVAQLFFNTPARRKFLKGISTEMAHIADVVAAMALGRPQVHFKLTHNDRTVKQWAKVTDSAQRTADVIGQVDGSDLIPIAVKVGDLKISGHLGPSRLARSTARGIFLYVNGRRVRDRVIQHALFEGYGSRLMKGRFPLAVLFLELPFDRVDVNVHPTKHEVRFVDQRRIHDSVRVHVAAALADDEKRLWVVPKTRAPQDHGEILPRTRVRLEPYRISPHTSSVDKVASPGSFEYHSKSDADLSVTVPTPGDTDQQKPPSVDNDQAHTEIADSAPVEPLPLQKQQSGAPQQTPLWQTNGFADLEVIGQFRGTYIICQGAQGLILIDQHAAHERIVYEHLRKGAARIDSQGLLVPETVELGYSEAGILESMIPRLNELGLELEHFGGNTFVVKSVPVLLNDQNIGRVVVELAEKAAEIGLESNPETLLDACRMVMACHHAIRANQRLTRLQLTHMLEQLDQCETPDHCPHGRPVWIQWTMKDLEKAFKRIVTS